MAGGNQPYTFPEPATQVELIILGGGGHARALIDSLRAGGYTASCAILDADESSWTKDVLGVPVIGNDSLLPQLVDRGARYFVVGLGATRDNRPRQRLFELGLAHKLEPLSVIHPSAVCSQWAKVGSGSYLLPSSVVNAGAVVGANVIVNSGAIVEHDCVVNDHAHVASGAVLASTVHVGRGAHIGAGATVRQCISIGDWAVVGAGAVVVKDVPAMTTVVGVPAREI